MSDIMSKINEATDRLTAIEKEMIALEVEASDHEAAARAARAKRMTLKQERESWVISLRSSQVVHATQLAAQAAETSRADAAKIHADAAGTLARLAEKEKQLDALLAKAAEKPADMVQP